MKLNWKYEATIEQTWNNNQIDMEHNKQQKKKINHKSNT